MKIGIVTHPIEANYGGILQAAALQRALRSMGHTPVTLRYSAPTTFERATGPRALLNKLSFLQMRKWLLVARDKDMIPGWVARKLKWKGLENHLRGRRLQTFVHRNITLSHRCSHPISASDVSKIGAEAYIVGSDQVWRYAHIPYKQMSFLSFLPRETRQRSFSYAASFGVGHWEMPEGLTRACRELAQDFKELSVREESGIALCRENLGREAECMPDPTMLLQAGDYVEMRGGEGDEAVPSEKGYIACYILDPTPEKQAYMDAVSRMSGLQCINICREGGNPESLQRSVEEWLSLIEHADYMLTDSFHGTVFSLIFGMSFISFDNPERGSSRFTSLLGKFGLQDRMRAADSEPLYAKIKPERWAAVKSAMADERQRGMHFLGENLA